MIRVAHVAQQLETGGMERLLVEFARHAARDRFALRFVCLGARGPIADDIESLGCPVTSLNLRPGVRPGAIFALASLFRDKPIDIVHTHNTRPLLYAGPAARIAGTDAIIHTRHGRRHGATARQRFLVRAASRCTHRIVCVSDDSARLSAAEGFDPDRLRTIHNGIDLGRFQFTGPVFDGPAVYVGRLSPEKDIASLLHAAAIVTRRRTSFRLQIAGAGPSEADLRARAERLALKTSVEFLGDVRDIPALLGRASMLVLPSRTEGLPLTVLEAMATGLPVVATRAGGTPEAVADGITGTLVAPSDPDRLAEAILQLSNDSGTARRMGAAGRRRAEEMFDVRTMVARYEALYNEVLGAAAAAHLRRAA